MAEKVASLYAEIGADTSGLKRGADEAKNTLKGLEGNMTALGEKMTRAGMVMTATLTAPIVAGFGKMIESASDLNETMNKVSVVFGDSADEVQRFGDTASHSLGMSKQTALEAAGTFGNLFTSMGMGAEVSADMSTSLLTLAADLASFNNIDPTVALEKLRAGLVGEVEPLRTLGVNLSAAAVEAKAFEMGIATQGETLSAAAKAQASYALIMEQTKNAQGDFARTSDGLANSTRIVKAQIADLAAEMGEQLLPIALDVVKGVSGLVQRFADMSPQGQKTILIVAGITAAMGPLLTVVGQLTKMLPVMFGYLASPVGLIVAGIGLVALGVYGLTQEVKDNTNALRENDGEWQKYEQQGHELTLQEEAAMMNINSASLDNMTHAVRAHNEVIAVSNSLLGYHGDTMSMVADIYGDYAAREGEVILATGALSSATEDAASAAETLSGAMGGLNPVISNVTSSFGSVYDIQEQLIGQGIQMIDGLGAQMRATALLAYWNGELTTSEYLAKIEQSYMIGNMERLNELFSQGAVSTYEWLRAVSDGTVTDAELNRVLQNGTDIIREQANQAIVLANNIRQIGAEARAVEGSYDIHFNITTSGEAPGGWSPDDWQDDVFVTPVGDVGFASGTDKFVVPPGYTNDNFPVYLSSGEQIAVAKPGESLPGGGGDIYNITLNAGGGDGYELYRQFRDALNNDMRTSDRAGARTSDY